MLTGFFFRSASHKLLNQSDGGKHFIKILKLGHKELFHDCKSVSLFL